MVDEAKLNAFIGKILGDLGGAFSAPLVRMGDKLGLYKALNEQGPMTSAELAAKTNVAERYAREWLSHQAASGYLEYDPAPASSPCRPSRRWCSPSPTVRSICWPPSTWSRSCWKTSRWSNLRFAPARASAGAISRSVCSARPDASSARAIKTISWPRGCRRWTASPPNSKRGAKVADVGCGHGFSTIIMAKAFPKSTFVGYDFHPASVEQARVHAEQHGATANTKFEVAMASDFPGKDLDLVTFFDCLHDMGDPVGAARHVRQTLKPDGSWMIVEPAAGDRLEDNLNPVSRMYYAGSTMICIPTSLDQPVGAALGAQAGFAKLSSAITQGGFGKVRKATETPFNMVLEARP